MDHEPSVSFAPHIGHYAIHKSPTVALAWFTRGRDQHKPYCTRVRLVLFEKSEPFKDPIVLDDVVSNARPQVNVKIGPIVSQDPPDQVECGVLLRVAQGWFGARSSFDFH